MVVFNYQGIILTCLKKLQPLLCNSKLLTRTMNEEQRAQDQRLNRIPKGDQKLFVNSVILKSRSPLQCQSTSFYRETNGLFTYRDCPRVKRIK
jgi:hypothetical protein